MKTTLEHLSEFKNAAMYLEDSEIIARKGSILFGSINQLDDFINEVILQRAGEPVAKYEDCGDVFGFRKLQDIKHNSLLYLAADPSVIDYVKTLREALKAMIDSAAMEKCGLKIADDAMEIPDSIKHLLT